MGEAAESLKAQKWKDAIPPEQKALQHLLRAEATRRDIQVAFGAARGGGGGGGGAGRDLESLFDLELDTEKNQYETGAQAAHRRDQRRRKSTKRSRSWSNSRSGSRSSRSSSVTTADPQQRWQQEMLRREAEELKKKMEELARTARSGPRAKPGQTRSAGSARAAANRAARSSGPERQSQQNSQLRQAIERLTRATDDMRQAANSQASQPQAGSAEARRAADRLAGSSRFRQRDAPAGIGSAVEPNLRRSADQSGRQQQRVRRQAEAAFGDRIAGPSDARTGSAAKAKQLAREKEQMVNDLNRLERDMQSAARNMAGTQRGASRSFVKRSVRCSRTS